MLTLCWDRGVLSGDGETRRNGLSLLRTDSWKRSFSPLYSMAIISSASNFYHIYIMTSVPETCLKSPYLQHKSTFLFCSFLRKKRAHNSQDHHATNHPDTSTVCTSAENPLPHRPVSEYAGSHDLADHSLLFVSPSLRSQFVTSKIFIW